MRWLNLLFICLVAIASGCGTVEPTATFTAEELAAYIAEETTVASDPGSDESSNSSDTSEMTALEQMEVAFDGNPSKSMIKPKLERAMSLYGLARIESNYSRAGSVLVRLRKANGIPELEILDFMICSHVPGVNTTFAAAAAAAATFISVGDSC